MYTRHKEIPVFSAWPSKVGARCFNTAQRALRRQGTILRLPLPDMAKLELILQPRDWIVVDPNLNDLPVVAWMGLQREPSLGIHEAVNCELRYYHGAAGKVAAKVPDLLIDALQEPIEEEVNPAAKILSFPMN